MHITFPGTLTRTCTALTLVVGGMAYGAQSAASKVYIVQLSDAPTATYSGGISGYAATRASAGAKLDFSAAHVKSYLGMLNSKRASVLASAGGGVRPLHTYNAVLNGFSANLTDAQVQALRNSPGVLSVSESHMQKIVTTRTPAFLGLSTPNGMWSKRDAKGREVKGEDVIIGMLDTGVWPEDLSFSDKVGPDGKPVAYDQPGTQVYGPPPAKWHGACATGPGFTAAMCNNKLIGARFYADEFTSLLGSDSTYSPFEYMSPRDGNGHGSHTSSTSGGNSDVAASIDGSGPVGNISGIAPRARLATYKVCWEAVDFGACLDGDVIAAVDDAVKDGVDVLSFSVSGTLTNLLEPVEVAFFNASAAGVFVAAAAGNTGLPNQVNHPSPWLTTVAASTHDRYTEATVSLGSGASYQGASMQSGLPQTPMVRAQDVGRVPYASLSPSEQSALTRCYSSYDLANFSISDNAALDPVKTAGKVVVCMRGTIALVNKSYAVQEAGGAGAIILNAPDTVDTLLNQPYPVPTVHLKLAAANAVIAYAATPKATGAFSASAQVPGTIAPVMATFSSRGPNRATTAILKPDMSAPGVSVIAAFMDDSLTQAQHDGVVTGNFRPQAKAVIESGTSMATPHVAGAAALVRQLHPNWSPAAIKSALMTSTNDIKLDSGALDSDRWGYGAGHIAPTDAGDPGLVYDAGTADYGRFLCGLGLPTPSGVATCQVLGSIDASALNLASLTVDDAVGTRVLQRTVTNVTGGRVTFNSSTSLPGWDVSVSPATLTLQPGESATFSVNMTRTTVAPGLWAFGSLVWTDGTHRVRSPLTVRGGGINLPAETSGTRPVGTTVLSLKTGLDGRIYPVASSLVPAVRQVGNVATGKKQCFSVAIGAGTSFSRFQLFNADTAGGSSTDLGLDVFSPQGVNVGSSNGPGSDEVVTLTDPAAGTYSACVSGVTTRAAGAGFTLSSWNIGATSAGERLTVPASFPANRGGIGSLPIKWTVPAGNRYLSHLTFATVDNVPLGATTLTVDAR